MMSECFDKLIDEEKDLVDTTTIQLQNAEPKHSIGLDCWCYEDKGHWLQSFRINGAIYGAIWSYDGSIFCWLCMIDEVDQGVPLHHIVALMYTNDEFIHHIRFDHWPMSK